MSGRIGDTLFVTSIIGPVKKSYPKAKISMLAHKNAMDLLKNNPDIDDLGNISNKRAKMKGWFLLKNYCRDFKISNSLLGLYVFYVVELQLRLRIWF